MSNGPDTHGTTADRLMTLPRPPSTEGNRCWSNTNAPGAGSEGTRTVGVWGLGPRRSQHPWVRPTTKGAHYVGGPHAPVRARLSLLPSGPGEVHTLTPHGVHRQCSELPGRGSAGPVGPGARIVGGLG